jgi:hypothetical protein
MTPEQAARSVEEAQLHASSTIEKFESIKALAANAELMVLQLLKI